MELKVGKAYFLIGYYDKEFEIPAISTHVFLGINALQYAAKDESLETEYCFQDGLSYGTHGNLVNSALGDTKGSFIVLTSKQLDRVVDKNGLIEWLKQEHTPEQKPEGN